MKKTYFPVSLSIVCFDNADVLTSSAGQTIDNEQYFNGAIDFFG